MGTSASSRPPPPLLPFSSTSSHLNLLSSKSHFTSLTKRAGCTCQPAAECETLASELAESRQGAAELQAERDELAAQLGATEAELQNATDNVEHLRSVLAGGTIVVLLWGGWGGVAAGVCVPLPGVGWRAREREVWMKQELTLWGTFRERDKGLPRPLRSCCAYPLAWPPVLTAAPSCLCRRVSRSEVEAAAQQQAELERQRADLEAKLHELGDAHALLAHQKGEVEAALEAAQSQLAEEREARAAAEVQREERGGRGGGGLKEPVWRRLATRLGQLLPLLKNKCWHVRKLAALPHAARLPALMHFY